MECPSCQFHNMPGSRACVRCGTGLDLSGVDFVPPRASGSMAVRGVRTRADRAVTIAGNFWLALSNQIHLAPFNLRHVTAGDLAASIIPGLGHARSGRRETGRVIFAVWTASLALTCLSVGTNWFWLFATLVIGTHCTTINLLLMDDLRGLSIPRRVFIGMGVYLTLMLLVYMPVWWAASQAGTLYTIPPGVGGRSVRPGDTLLLSSHWTRRPPERGDLVRATYPALMGNGMYFYRLDTVDRIVGLPGDSVVIRKGIIYLNHEPMPPETAPLDALPYDLELDLVCPENYAIVIPSAARWQSTANADFAVNHRSYYIANRHMVPLDEIFGRVLLRVRPLTRAGAVRPAPAPLAEPHESNSPTTHTTSASPG